VSLTHASSLTLNTTAAVTIQKEIILNSGCTFDALTCPLTLSANVVVGATSGASV
jgi:hypothetical protein